jgi:hypothetical protein
MKIAGVEVPGIVLAIVALPVGYAAWRVTRAVATGADALAEGVTVIREAVDTDGTPYEGYGVVGSLASATNRALGGIPQTIGEKIGGLFADLRLREGLQ